MHATHRWPRCADKYAERRTTCSFTPAMMKGEHHVDRGRLYEMPMAGRVRAATVAGATSLEVGAHSNRGSPIERRFSLLSSRFMAL